MMGKIYCGQSSLRLVLKTFVDLSSVASAGVRFFKPDGSSGEFEAVVVDPQNGLLVHDFVSGELDTVGWWRFWAFVQFSDGRTAAGDAAKVYVWREGS